MLTYAIVLALAFACLILFGLLFLYSFYIGKFSERDSEIYKKAQTVIEDAHKKAKEILDEASEKSKQIIASADHSKIDLDNELKGSIRETAGKGIKLLEDQSQNVSKAYQETFEEVKVQFIKQVKDTLGKVQEAGETGLQEFRVALKDQQLTSQYYIEKRLNQEFDQAQKEVARYKDEQMRRVEDSVDRIILRLSEEVLGKAISLEDHEKLILESLSKAKEEGLFN